jgi:hypothetical protein
VIESDLVVEMMVTVVTLGFGSGRGEMVEGVKVKVGIEWCG